MSDHPLTYEIMGKIHGDRPGYSNPFDEGDMRAVADWQLEQVVWYLECYNDPIWGDRLTDEFQTLIHDLKKAMRPQQLENN